MHQSSSIIDPTNLKKKENLKVKFEPFRSILNGEITLSKVWPRTILIWKCGWSLIQLSICPNVSGILSQSQRNNCLVQKIQMWIWISNSFHVQLMEVFSSVGVSFQLTWNRHIQIIFEIMMTKGRAECQFLHFKSLIISNCRIELDNVFEQCYIINSNLLKIWEMFTICLDTTYQTNGMSHLKWFSTVSDGQHIIIYNSLEHSLILGSIYFAI